MTLRPFALAAGAVALGDTTNNHSANEAADIKDLFDNRRMSQVCNTLKLTRTSRGGIAAEIFVLDGTSETAPHMRPDARHFFGLTTV